MGKFKYNPFTDELDRVDLEAGSTDISGTDESVLFIDGDVIGEDAQFKYDKTLNELKLEADDASVTVGASGDGKYYWDGDQIVLESTSNNDELLRLLSPGGGGLNKMLQLSHDASMSIELDNDGSAVATVAYDENNNIVKITNGGFFNSTSAEINLGNRTWTFNETMILTQPTTGTDKKETLYIGQITTTGTAQAGLGIVFRFDIEVDDGSLLQAAGAWGCELTNANSANPKTKLVFQTKDGGTLRTPMEVWSQGYVGVNNDAPDSSLHVKSRATGHDLLKLEGIVSQSGNFLTVLDSSSNEVGSIESDGEFIDNDRPLKRYALMGA